MEKRIPRLPGPEKSVCQELFHRRGAPTEGRGTQSPGLERSATGFPATGKVILQQMMFPPSRIKIHQQTLLWE